MRVRMIAIAALALVGGALAHRVGASFPRSTPQVIAFPSAGHRGDTIYVSGSGFLPRQQLAVLAFCPEAPAPRSGRKLAELRTDAAGRFIAYRLRAVIPGSNGPVDCRIVATPQSSSARASSPGARYRILAQGAPLPSCSTHICLHVTASLVRLHSETQGTVVVSGWPGATTTVTITGPHIRAIVRRMRLNWRGVGSVHARVSLGLIRGVSRQASVVARLNGVSGKATASFSVVPGGR